MTDGIIRQLGFGLVLVCLIAEPEQWSVMGHRVPSTARHLHRVGTVANSSLGTISSRPLTDLNEEKGQHQSSKHAVQAQLAHPFITQLSKVERDSVYETEKTFLTLLFCNAAVWNEVDVWFLDCQPKCLSWHDADACTHRH